MEELPKQGQKFDEKPVDKIAESFEIDNLDNLELEGKSIEADKIVENLELGVRYKETIIELPEHRQKETGIKRITRRELLPPLPKGLFVSGEESPYYPGSNGLSPQGRANLKETTKGHPYYSCAKEFDDLYKFITNNIYPSEESLVHVFNIGLLHGWPGHDNPIEHSERLKKDGLYFQEIFNINGESKLFEIGDDGVMKDFNKSKADFNNLPEDKKAGIYRFFVHGCGQAFFGLDSIATPVFLFTNKNKVFLEYVESVLNNQIMCINKEGETENILDSFAPNKRFQNVLNKILRGEISKMGEVWIPSLKHPDIKPLRWCHSECALVPTKRSLNILFFETD
jgi:hypothetical protein